MAVSRRQNYDEISRESDTGNQNEQLALALRYH